MHHPVTHTGADRVVSKEPKAAAQLSSFHSGGFWPGVGSHSPNIHTLALFSAQQGELRGLPRLHGQGKADKRRQPSDVTGSWVELADMLRVLNASNATSIESSGKLLFLSEAQFINTTTRMMTIMEISVMTL